MPGTRDLPKVARCLLGDLWSMQKQICWHDGAPASCSGAWTCTGGNSTSGTHSFWWPLQNETQEKERTETLFQDHITKPWLRSIAHWRGCDQDANIRTKQRPRGNGNWLSPLNSFNAPPSLSHSLPSSDISFTPLTFAHTYRGVTGHICGGCATDTERRILAELLKLVGRISLSRETDTRKEWGRVDARKWNKHIIIFYSDGTFAPTSTSQS